MVGIEEMAPDDLPWVQRCKADQVWRGIHGGPAEGTSRERVRSIVAAALTEDLLRRSVGFVAREGRRRLGFVLASEISNELDGSDDGFLHSIGLGRGLTTDLGYRLLGRLVEAAREREWAFIRGVVPWCDEETAERLVLGGFDLASISVGKRLRRISPEALRNCPVLIREAGPEDMDFILKLLAEALWGGLHPLESRRVSRRQVAVVARSILASVIGPDMAVLVATDRAKRPVGHVTASLRRVEELSGRIEARLYDSYVVASHRGRGIATCLVDAVEILALRAGRTCMTGTAFGRNAVHTARLLGGLAQRGWRPETRVFLKEVAPSPRRGSA